MSALHIHNLGLFLHLVGITCIAGGCLSFFLIETQLWKQMKVAPYRAVTLLPVLRLFPFFIQGGSILMLASGMMLLGAVYWTPASHVSFVFKLLLYLLLNINCLLIAKPSVEKLHHLLPNQFETDPEQNTALNGLRTRMKWFHLSELAILTAIYILSIYKF